VKTAGRYWRIAEAIAFALVLAFLSGATVQAGAWFVDEIEVLEVDLCPEDPECEADCDMGCQETFGSCWVKPGTDGGPVRYCHYNHCNWEYGAPPVALCTYYCYRFQPCPGH
jgi:hypothetical protein